MQIEKMLCLSTAHVTSKTAERLNKDDMSFPTCYPMSTDGYNYGCFVYVPDNFEEEYADAPADLKDCFRLALSQGCSWIMFDEAAEVEEGLPVYEW